MDLRTELRLGCLVTVTCTWWNGCLVGDAAVTTACLRSLELLEAASVWLEQSEQRQWAVHAMPFWKHSQYFFRHLDFLQRHPRWTTAFDFCGW